MRYFRQPAADTCQKISMARQGKHHSEITKQRISNSMRRYWMTIPNRPKDEDADSNKNRNTRENGTI